MINYVYICSAGHSGSTLLDLLLGSHSKIETVGEISHLSKNIALNTKCTCGESVRSCAVWEDVLSIVGDQLGINVFKDPYALHMGYSKATVIVDKAHQDRTYLLKRKLVLGLYYLNLHLGIGVINRVASSFDKSIKHTFMVYDAVRNVLNTDVVVDSSKEYLKAVGIYRYCPVKARIIVLTRDGRGVFYSNLKRNYSRQSSLNAWKRHYSRAMPLLRKYVDDRHILEVKYEDLANDSAAEVARICDFVGLEYESDMLNFSSIVHHSTNGNDMRFSESSTIRPDNSWQDKMTRQQLQYFDRKAGSLNREFGYK